MDNFKKLLEEAESVYKTAKDKYMSPESFGWEETDCLDAMDILHSDLKAVVEEAKALLKGERV